MTLTSDPASASLGTVLWASSATLAGAWNPAVRQPWKAYLFRFHRGGSMSSLAQAKTLGGIGSILIILSVVPSAGPLLAIIGLVLVLVAVKYISDAVGDRSIFNNMIVAVVLAIVGLAVGAFLLF